MKSGAVKIFLQQFTSILIDKEVKLLLILKH